MHIVFTDLKLFLSNLLKILVFLSKLTMLQDFYSVFSNFHQLVVRCLSKFLRLAWPWNFCNIQNEFVLKVNILVKDININSLTKIIGHHIVPVESFDTVVEKEILDNVIENESETLVVKDLLNKHYVGDEQLKMTVAKPNRFGCAREFFSTLPSQKDLLQYACFLRYFCFEKRDWPS